MKSWDYSALHRPRPGAQCSPFIALGSPMARSSWSTRLTSLFWYNFGILVMVLVLVLLLHAPWGMLGVLIKASYRRISWRRWWQSIPTYNTTFEAHTKNEHTRRVISLQRHPVKLGYVGSSLQTYIQTVYNLLPVTWRAIKTPAGFKVGSKHSIEGRIQPSQGVGYSTSWCILIDEITLYTSHYQSLGSAA